MLNSFLIELYIVSLMESLFFFSLQTQYILIEHLILAINT